MTSLQTAAKQIPLNNGFYRVVPALIQGYGVPGVASATAGFSVSSYMYTLANGVLTGYTPQSAAVQIQLSSGQALLKDMGVKFLSSSSTGLSSPQVFRRVQVVNTASGATTDGVNGTSTGSDSDYDCAYISMGFNGSGPALGPFIRTG